MPMARIKKLSVEKALNELRKADAPEPPSRDEKTEALHKEIARMKAQRLRLDRSSTKRD